MVVSFGLLGLAVLVAVVDLAGNETRGAPNRIDSRIALQIGDHGVSHYLVDKYYGRFADEVRQRAHRVPSSGESRAWLELFLAKQVLVAHATRLGYRRHPDVTRIVERMERHMLSQSAPTVHEAVAVLSPDRIRMLHQQSLTILDLTVVHFEDDAVMTSCLGEGFWERPLDEQRSRILAARDLPGVELVEGPLSWPYPPFSEIAEPIAAVPPGRWLQHRDPAFGSYLIMVRSISLPPAGSGTADASFAQFIRHVDAEVMQRREEKIRLTTAALSIEKRTIRQASELWRLLPPQGELPTPLDQDLAAMPLARYQVDGQKITISLGDFCRHFNALFIRRLPRQPAELRQEVENMVLAELNLHAAREAGIDRTPQFTEDRHGFASLQALDAFEKDFLLPEVAVGPADIERHYRIHIDEFKRITRIRGRWLEFSNALEASRWIQTEDPAVPYTEQEMELSVEAPLAGMERFNRIFFGSPIAAKAGPFPHGTVYVIFIKQADVASSPMPLAEVSDAIRRTLTRSALDQRELALARDLSARYAIEDHIDYARYGVSPGDLALPWTR